jgi:hypothetical protein
MDFGNIMVEDEVEYYQETFGVKEPWKIPTDKLEDCSYKDIRRIDDEFRELKKENEKLKKKASEVELANFCEKQELSDKIETLQEVMTHSDKEIKNLRKKIKILGVDLKTSQEMIEGLKNGQFQILTEKKELIEGHKVIYDALRAAEGTNEMMTGPEPDCIADSITHYIEGYHTQQDEIEKLKEDNKEYEFENLESGVRERKVWEDLFTMEKERDDQQRETDIEHTRYMETLIKGSGNLCEIAQELGIEDEYFASESGGMKEIITSIKKLEKSIKD